MFEDGQLGGRENVHTRNYRYALTVTKGSQEFALLQELCQRSTLVAYSIVKSLDGEPSRCLVDILVAAGYYLHVRHEDLSGGKREMYISVVPEEYRLCSYSWDGGVCVYYPRDVEDEFVAFPSPLRAFPGWFVPDNYTTTIPDAGIGDDYVPIHIHNTLMPHRRRRR